MEAKICIGDKLDLEKIDKRLSVDPEKKPDRYSSQVLDEGKNGTYYVAMPIQEGKLIPLAVGQEFNATFYSKGGLFQSKVVILGRYKKGSIFLMEIDLLTPLKKVQRREYFRFPCRIPLEYRVIEELEKAIIEPGDAYSAEEWQLEWKNGVMLDLSGGGIRFVSSFLEQKGSIVQIRFNITNDEEEPDIIYSFANVLRSERNENKNNLYDNRVEFWRMDQGTREKIIRFIFEEQRRNRSKKLGLDN